MTFNSRLYDWSEVEIRVAGLLLIGVTGLQFSVKQEKEAVYGKGTKPLAIKSGNESVEGSISVLQPEMEKLLDLAPEGKITKLKGIDIQVAFAGVDGVVTRYSLTGVEFTENSLNPTQNAKFLQMELPFLALDYQRK